MKKLYYLLKPAIPRKWQIALRRYIIGRKRRSCSNVWPIDESAGRQPVGWTGWPENKRFAFVLTHDVDTLKGHERCLRLMHLEKGMGFCSSFNFVPRRYDVSGKVLREITDSGFEVGVHGLYHDGKLYSSYDNFLKRVSAINGYLTEWGAVGFRSPAMHHNLEWIQNLTIEYDASTFDTDPFEPQPDSVCTIFPFYVHNTETDKGYVELPYTLAQDFTLFILMKENNIDIWKQKLDWIVDRGGMALVNVHPDYTKIGNSKCELGEYPVRLYLELLEYVENKYSDQFWQPLPKQVAGFVRDNISSVNVFAI